MLDRSGGPRGREHPPPSFLASLRMDDPQPVFLEILKQLAIVHKTGCRTHWRGGGARTKGPPPRDYLGRSVRYFWPEVVEWMAEERQACVDHFAPTSPLFGALGFLVLPHGSCRYQLVYPPGARRLSPCVAIAFQRLGEY